MYERVNPVLFTAVGWCLLLWLFVHFQKKTRRWRQGVEWRHGVDNGDVPVDTKKQGNNPWAQSLHF